MGDNITRFDQLSLFGDDVADTPSGLGGNVDLDRLDAPVAAGDTFRKFRRLEQQIECYACRDNGHGDPAQDKPAFALGLRHCVCPLSLSVEFVWKV